VERVVQRLRRERCSSDQRSENEPGKNLQDIPLVVMPGTIIEPRKKVHTRATPGLATTNQSLGFNARFLHHAAPLDVVGLDLLHRLRWREDLGVAAGRVDAREEVLVRA